MKSLILTVISIGIAIFLIPAYVFRLLKKGIKDD